jgi:hypothetical protein
MEFTGVARGLCKVGQFCFRVALGVGQSHHRTRFPADLALGIQVSHRITAAFEIAQDFGEQLGLGAIRMLPLFPFVFDIDPESESLVQAKSHVGLLAAEDALLNFCSAFERN